jgi:hypothetical protein
MTRKVRIVVSVFFGVLTLSLVVLWVRTFGVLTRNRSRHKIQMPRYSRGVPARTEQSRYGAYDH